MQNYFNYFTEIEERFQQRRGSLLMLSTLDWALIEAWQEAGVPLEAVLRGIDQAFDKHEAQKQRAQSRGRTRKINGLAWAAQSVMEATEALVDAATGAPVAARAAASESGFEPQRIAAFLEENAAMIAATGTQQALVERLRALAVSLTTAEAPSLEDLNRTLSVLEEKMFATLLAAAPEEELARLDEQAARELAPYRGKMQAVQIRQVQQQFLQKRLLAAHGLPRLSLFYMSHREAGGEATG